MNSISNQFLVKITFTQIDVTFFKIKFVDENIKQIEAKHIKLLNSKIKKHFCIVFDVVVISEYRRKSHLDFEHIQ